jgi:hypothetical protein
VHENHAEESLCPDYGVTSLQLRRHAVSIWAGLWLAQVAMLLYVG